LVITGHWIPNTATSWINYVFHFIIINYQIKSSCWTLFTDLKMFLTQTFHLLKLFTSYFQLKKLDNLLFSSLKPMMKQNFPNTAIHTRQRPCITHLNQLKRIPWQINRAQLNFITVAIGWNTHTHNWLKIQNPQNLVRDTHLKYIDKIIYEAYSCVGRAADH